MISGFQVIGGPAELLGPVALMPTVSQALTEDAAAGRQEAQDRAGRRMDRAARRARRRAAWRVMATCTARVAQARGRDLRPLDATVVTAHSDEELAEPEFHR